MAAVSYTHLDVYKRQPLDGGAEVAYEPGRYAYSPKMNGNYIAFLSSTSGPPRDIYLMEKGGETKLIESGVLNFDMGQDFLAYTKDQNVYILSLIHISSERGNWIPSHWRLIRRF